MSEIAEYVDIRSTETGNLKAISDRIRDDESGQGILIRVEHADVEQLAALGKSIEVVARLVSRSMIVEQATIEGIVSLLVPKAPVRPSVLIEAQMLANAKNAVLSSGEWLSSKEIACLAGFTSKNTSSQPNKWKADKKIFAIRHNGSDYFPLFALDDKEGFRPISALADVLNIFGDTKEGWGLALWFSSDNSYLGGKCPKDLLRTAPDRVIEAAKHEVEGVMHG